ncbi:MAG TPA: hypothetical protein PLO67_10110 [Saprospiraceae bacterium]|nr:hypothetical protein [Saprospiraceae bacterium]HPI06426.1 hypothetical protein [Saprospiraceae bacterium]
MKQTTSKPTVPKAAVSPEIKSLLAKADKAEKALQMAYADYEKKQIAYKEALHADTAKNDILPIWTAFKIARLTCKIKRMEFKLAKNEYKFAKKAAKKTEQKTHKEQPAVEAPALQSKQKKIKTAGSAA